ncbi:Methylmalonyl-CoA mutase [Lutibacter agarilyticus]|uniref:Methylmalonyl-CoA mutase n=1 Tax=Lutibacter agarilyticus TaxID=1109740 RepID=A0A238WIW7_9FLAO|nr:methylmalonyl-CoA mutase family protein [Lutibacter agarilyticus]SNR46512.1 Methylmalonyl-CoA mutase [Lutibacter agarilyticus]
MKRKDFSDLKIETQNEKDVYFEHEEFIAGTAPFLRGIYPTMYLEKPLETKILVEFSSPQKCNTFIKEHITKGYKYFTFHINSNNTNPIDEKETGGILISNTEDVKTLFNEIKLQNLEITIYTENNTLNVIKLLNLGLRELQTSLENLNFNIQLNTSANIIDVFEYFIQHNIKSIEISNTRSIENKTPEADLADLLFTSYVCIQHHVSKGNTIDSIANKISFNLKLGNKHFIEIAKARSARMLWAKIIHLFNPKKQASYALKLHATIENATTILPAIFGGYQSATSFETEQLVALEETGITKTVDPWAGSNYMEQKTAEITSKAWLLFEGLKNK